VKRPLMPQTARSIQPSILGGCHPTLPGESSIDT
jgi:hypothetical protein